MSSVGSRSSQGGMPCFSVLLLQLLFLILLFRWWMPFLSPYFDMPVFHLYMRMPWQKQLCIEMGFSCCSRGFLVINILLSLLLIPMKPFKAVRMMVPMVLNYGTGQQSSFLADPNGVRDVVSVDKVVNATLAAIARHGMSPKPKIYIYQIASLVVNPLVFKDLARATYKHYKSSSLLDPKVRPIYVIPSLKVFDSMEDFSSHLWRDAIRRIE